jgi:hypothetical protein
MVTKEIQTKKKTSIWKKDRRRRKTLLTKTHFSGETMIQRKKKQRNKLFYIQQQKRKEFSEWKRLNWLNYSSRKTLGEAVCFSDFNSKLNYWIILPAFLNGIPTREDEDFRSENRIASQFFNNSDRKIYVGKAAGFAYWIN